MRRSAATGGSVVMSRGMRGQSTGRRGASAARTRQLPRARRLDPRVVRTPSSDRFLDVLAAELFVERALDQTDELRVGSKTQGDALSIGQLGDARVHRRRQ